MAVCELAIVYQPEGGETIELARVFDRRLLVATARRAIADRGQWADEIGKREPALGTIERAETQKLRMILSELIPDMAGVPPAGGSIQ